VRRRIVTVTLWASYGISAICVVVIAIAAGQCVFGGTT